MARKFSKKILYNKFVIATVIFLFIIFFLDSNNLLDRFALMSERQELKDQIKNYDREIIENNRKLKELQTNTENLEKFAREEYYMKNKNEDVYLIEEQE